MHPRGPDVLFAAGVQATEDAFSRRDPLWSAKCHASSSLLGGRDCREARSRKAVLKNDLARFEGSRGGQFYHFTRKSSCIKSRCAITITSRLEVIHCRETSCRRPSRPHESPPSCFSACRVHLESSSGSSAQRVCILSAYLIRYLYESAGTASKISGVKIRVNPLGIASTWSRRGPNER